jgi:DNA-binding Lrp family transcriptional regulator
LRQFFGGETIPTEAGKLTTRELRVLMALEEKPLATYEELANKTGYAKSVVFNLIQPLADPKGESPFFTVTALPNLEMLGLEIVDIILEVKTLENLELLKKLAWEHPYTSFLAFIYGHTNGMLIQFRIPKSTGVYIYELFQGLQTRGIVESFEYLNFPFPQIYTVTDVHAWNYQTYSWNFNWREWFSKVFESIKPYSGQYNTGANEIAPINPNIEIPVKNWFNRKDILILYELFENSRRRNVDIMEILKVKGFTMSPQTFSRRLKRIMDQCVEGNQVALDPKCTNVLSWLVLNGEGDPALIASLRAHIEQHPIPFTSTFKTKYNHFFWFIELPPNDIGMFLTIMRQILTKMSINYIDTSNVKSYHPYHLAYDEKARKWIQSKDFMVDSVLKFIDKTK